jgi:hypothetical protein
MADTHFHPFIAILHPIAANIRFHPFLPILDGLGIGYDLVSFRCPGQLAMALRCRLFHVFWTHEKKTFFS